MRLPFLPPADNCGSIRCILPHKREEAGESMRKNLCETWENGSKVSSCDLWTYSRDSPFYFCEDINTSKYRNLLEMRPENYQGQHKSLLSGRVKVSHQDIRAWLDTYPYERDGRRDVIVERHRSAKAWNQTNLLIGGLALTGAMGGGGSNLSGICLGVAIGSTMAAAHHARVMRAQIRTANADLYLKTRAC